MDGAPLVSHCAFLLQLLRSVAVEENAAVPAAGAGAEGPTPLLCSVPAAPALPGLPAGQGRGEKEKPGKLSWHCVLAQSAIVGGSEMQFSRAGCPPRAAPGGTQPQGKLHVGPLSELTAIDEGKGAKWKTQL